MQQSKCCALPLGDSPKAKGGYRDSNPGPPEPQSGALTNCAIPTILKSVPEGIRTPDPRLRRPLLYPAELQTHLSVHTEKRVMGIEPTYLAWKASVLPLNYTCVMTASLCGQCPKSESNQRHEDFQSSALPTELSGQNSGDRI